MILTQKALEGIKGNRRLMHKLGLELDYGEQWIVESIKRNVNNGPFTTWAALELIKKDLGLSLEEVLIPSPEAVEQA